MALPSSFAEDELLKKLFAKLQEVLECDFGLELQTEVLECSFFTLLHHSLKTKLQPFCFDFWNCCTSLEIRSDFEKMGKPLIYEILEKPATSCIIAICSAIWFYIQKKNIGYSHVGLSYETAMEGQYWRIITSAFSHISIIHLVFNMSALWSLGVVEQLDHLGLGVEYYLQYTLVLIVVSGVLVLAMYHLLIQRFKASFIGHLSGIVVGYAIAWGLIHGMTNYWALSLLGWIVLVFVLSLKKSGALDLSFIEIESVTDPSLPSVRFLGSGNGRTLQMSALPDGNVELV
ncbi:hypothetical protein P8452_37822 [Trifolium repens]|nr:hypothetical protein P8452_37822 [Trifolium repens]